MSITCVCVCVHYSHDPHVIRFMFECMCYSCCNVYERCTQSAYALCMHECAMHSVGVVMHCGELLTPCPGGSRSPATRSLFIYIYIYMYTHMYTIYTRGQMYGQDAEPPESNATLVQTTLREDCRNHSTQARAHRART